MHIDAISLTEIARSFATVIYCTYFAGYVIYQLVGIVRAIHKDRREHTAWRDDLYMRSYGITYKQYQTYLEAERAGQRKDIERETEEFARYLREFDEKGG